MILRRFIRQLSQALVDSRRRGRDSLQIHPTARIPRDALLSARLTVGAHSGANRGFVAKGQGEIQIGRYSAIGQNVTIISGEHPTGRLAVQFGLYRDLGWDHREVKTDGVSVGNDVWIGDRAIVLPGVTIGDGAVVGAGAVVTRNVSPFDIVAGVPAEHVRWRFDDDIRELIARSRWWRLEPGDLRDVQELFEASLSDVRAEWLEERLSELG